MKKMIKEFLHNLLYLIKQDFGRNVYKEIIVFKINKIMKGCKKNYFIDL